MKNQFDVLWQQFKAAGLLDKVYPLVGVPLQRGEPVDVGWEEPDVSVLNGAGQSRQYLIEYQAKDMTLTKGDQLERKSNGKRYVVRQPPFIPDSAYQGNDGTFMRVYLAEL